ncbi:MAG: hypothetical protein AAF438_15585, partial [Pseudomonadota bacterium]
MKEHITQEHTVTIEECQRMKKFHVCKHGPLSAEGGIFRTHNKMNWYYPGGGINCCRWVKFEAWNCFLYPTSVYKRHHAKVMEGTVGDVSHCKYYDQGCLLSDGRALIWEVDHREVCEFIMWDQFDGQAYGNAWLERTGRIGLTLQPKSKEQDDSCDGRPVRLSAQGVAYRILYVHENTYDLPADLLIQAHHQIQTKNGKPKIPGPVTSDHLAISLQAVLNTVRNDLRQSFQQSLQATCRNMAITYKILRTSVIANPTLSMRQLLNDPYVYGRASGELIEIWPCHQIPFKDYTILAMNDTCTLEFPIQFRIRGHTEFGFLDPTTKIIHATGAAIDCALVQNTVLERNGTSLSYSRETGELTPIKSVPVLGMLKLNYSGILHLQDSTYYQLIMHNWTELQSQVSLHEMQSSLQHHMTIMKHLEVEQHRESSQSTDRVTATLMKRGQFGFLTGLNLDWKQIWIFAVCTYVTGFVILFHCCPLSRKFLPTLPSISTHIAEGLGHLSVHRPEQSIRPRRRRRRRSTDRGNRDRSASPGLLRRWSQRFSSRPIILYSPQTPRDAELTQYNSNRVDSIPGPPARPNSQPSPEVSADDSWTTPYEERQTFLGRQKPISRSELCFDQPVPPGIITRFQQMTDHSRRATHLLRNQCDQLYSEFKHRLTQSPNDTIRRSRSQINAVSDEDDVDDSAVVINVVLNESLSQGALLDSGSALTLITEDLVHQLN